MTGRDLLKQAHLAPPQYVVLINVQGCRFYATGIDEVSRIAGYRSRGEKTGLPYRKLQVGGELRSGPRLRVWDLVSRLEVLPDLLVEIFAGWDSHKDLCQTESSAGAFWLRSRV